MRVVAGLCWYDEQPSFLAATIASLKGVADHLVAVDGAYYLYPHGRRSSGAEQHEVIVETAYGAGLGLSLHVPAQKWIGNELEKRNYLLDACKLVCDNDRDWIFCIDGDEVVTQAPDGWRDRLAAAEAEMVAGVTFWNRHPVENVAAMARQFWWRREDRLLRHRCMWRALPDLHIEGAHYCYLADGRLLRGAYGQNGEEPCLDLWDFEVEHRHDYRDLDRNQSALKYAELRDISGAEKPVQL